MHLRDFRCRCHSKSDRLLAGEKADAEAAAAKAAEDTAKLEEEVACRLALMHELGVQSGKVGSFPTPGTPGFGLAVKAVTKYVASSIGGKGVSPVIPLGTFGVIKELYTTIRAFFDPRTAPGKLQFVVKLQQMQKKNGQRYLLNDAIAEVEKMAKLMDTGKLNSSRARHSPSASQQTIEQDRAGKFFVSDKGEFALALLTQETQSFC